MGGGAHDAFLKGCADVVASPCSPRVCGVTEGHVRCSHAWPIAQRPSAVTLCAAWVGLSVETHLWVKRKAPWRFGNETGGREQRLESPNLTSMFPGAQRGSVFQPSLAVRRGFSLNFSQGDVPDNTVCLRQVVRKSSPGESALFPVRRLEGED